MEHCNCIQEIAELLREQTNNNKDKPPGYIITNLQWQHKTIYPDEKLYTHFIIEGTYTKKNGSASKPQNIITTVIFSYCPFCGKEYPENNNIPIIIPEQLNNRNDEHFKN